MTLEPVEMSTGYVFIVCAITWNAAFWLFQFGRMSRELSGWIIFISIIPVMICDGVLSVLCALTDQPANSVLYGVLTVGFSILAWLIWRWLRRNRKKIHELIGEKSKALRDKLVQKIRELKPKPVLRPVPQPV